MTLAEGWYLMSVPDLEIELARARGETRGESNALHLTVEDALAYRDAGNLPDEHGRTLRLVLRIEGEHDLRSLDAKRARYEPDYHEAPLWRREGSAPVNVVPLRVTGVAAEEDVAWWEDPAVAELEEEWSRTGAVGGLRIPADYRSFVYKTVIALRLSGREVTVETVSDSIARWLSPEDHARVKAELERANR